MSDDPLASASPGYALGRLLRALDTASSHADPEVRRRAATRSEQWRLVVDGIASGRLAVGSRTPVADTPAWITLEVVHGGFATGRYLAEGPLEPHEEALLAELPADVPGATPRARLNQWFLGDAGQRLLVDAIRSGRLTIALPEEGALPAIAWLLEAGADADALDLVAILRPFFERLRFYPRLEATPRPLGAVVRLATIREVAEGLRAARPQRHVAAMNEALRVWTPLHDRLVALWLDTVDGEPPGCRRDADGDLDRSLHGDLVIVGGWPCRRWPDDWAQRRDAWLADYRAAAAAHRRCGKHRDDRRSFAWLRDALERAPIDSRDLKGRDVARIRRALASTITRSGAPGSPSRSALRELQASIAARPSKTEFTHLLARRLEVYPAAGGLAALDPIAIPIQAGEHPSIPEGTPIPAPMIAKAARALEAPIAELVDRGVIPSAEVLAIVLPQISAQIVAAGIVDPGLRGLYGQTYAAFRRRRSLLLLNLEHQVQYDELPWIAALSPLRREDLVVDTATLARQTLEELTLLALTAFPETILPNPLIREMSTLANRAGLALPLTEEVAADIFMGTFTRKWLRAARSAAELLAGTVYARYYDLPAVDHPALQEPLEVAPPPKRSRRRSKPTADAFAGLCAARSKESGRGGSYTAHNGAILEQSQILTTHNLAVLLAGQGLVERARALAPAMARSALRFVVRRQTQVAPGFGAQLQAIKNAAYAWRQAIFFLSLVDEATQRGLVDELAGEVAGVRDRVWARRFEPAVVGLRHVVDGGCFDAEGRGPGPEPAHRFLGWALGKHWLFA
ncbi:MAG: hypothetical protein R3B09_34905 [Nannocystaceae bacterium]